MIRHFFTLSLVSLFVLLCGSLSFAQTTNRQAQEWFEKSQKEKDLDKKLEALHKAVEADPQFVHALYYLGLTYKSRRDFVRAEQYLNQAKEASATLREDDHIFPIYLELAKVQIRTGNAASAEKLLQESVRMNVDKELVSKAYFELGRLLFNQSRYPEALDVLRAGQQMSAAQREFFTNLIVLADRSLRLDKLYVQATGQLKAGNAREAKNLFEQINLENPEFKDVDAKIAQVDSVLRVELTQSTLTELYSQAARYEQDGDYALAIANYESILQKSANFKDVQFKLNAARNKMREQQSAKILTATYQEGMSAFNRREWTRAIAAFERVADLDANYLDTHQRLAEARRQVEPDTLESVLFRYYKFGLESMENDDFDEALRAFRRVKKLKPDYRNVSSLISVLEQASLGAANSQTPEMNADSGMPFSESHLDSLYTEALILMDHKDWLQAIVHLEKLRLIKQDYRDVNNLLFEARTNLTENDLDDVAVSTKEGEPGIALIAGSVIAIVMLPLLGFVVFSPMARARMYLLRGNYTAAALIYENALAQNPGKLKLYPKLAHLYLLSGRNDETAIKVFKTVLKLNLETDERNEMNSIVRNYLQAGKPEGDAISALESALRSEQSKE